MLLRASDGTRHAVLRTVVQHHDDDDNSHQGNHLTVRNVRGRNLRPAAPFRRAHSSALQRYREERDSRHAIEAARLAALREHMQQERARAAPLASLSLSEHEEQVKASLRRAAPGSAMFASLRRSEKLLAELKALEQAENAGKGEEKELKRGRRQQPQDRVRKPQRKRQRSRGHGRRYGADGRTKCYGMSALVVMVALIAMLIATTTVTTVMVVASTGGNNNNECTSDDAATCPGKRDTAYVTLVSGDSENTLGYAIGALALGQSLAVTDPGRRRLCMVLPTTLAAARGILERSSLWEVFEVDSSSVGGVGGVRGSITAAEERAAGSGSTVREEFKHAATWAKLHVFDPTLVQLAELRAFIFVDADAFVRGPGLGHLFGNEDDASAAAVSPMSAVQNVATPRCADADHCFSKEREFNTGVMRLRPGPDLYDGLAVNRKLSQVSAQRKASWNTDQDALNDVLAGKYDAITTLDRRYNTLMCCSQTDERLRALAESAVVAHFSVSTMYKPWEMFRYDAQMQLGQRTADDFARRNIMLHSDQHSVFHAVYTEWKAMLARAVAKLGADDFERVQRHVLRDVD